MLTDSLCHVSIHTERRRCSSGDYSTRFTRIRSSIGLGELESREILGCFVCCKGIVIRLEHLTMGSELEGDDEGCKQVVGILEVVERKADEISIRSRPSLSALRPTHLGIRPPSSRRLHHPASRLLSSSGSSSRVFWAWKSRTDSSAGG